MRAANPAEPADIAVIGIGCRFPDADSTGEFYANLMARRDSVREIPESRWRHRGLYDGTGGGNRIASKWGGFISGVDEFDARFFKILPSEAEGMDPQQKLFLTCSWEALEDAGYSRRKRIAGAPVGVYAGVTWNEFSLLANEYGYLQDRYKGAGSLLWGIPNRVSYFFDFTGPSLAVDTACSSSLVALHLAANALRSGECGMALAGGVNLNLHPAKYLFLSNANFLSKEGKCRGFGEGGNGYVPSEGVGVLVLKRLEDAEADGDRIYGIVKSTATNHGGKATGYTVPNPQAHGRVIRAAIERAGVGARDITYLECHGTGTDLGDPIEIAGLRSAFEAETLDRRFCGIGTVKSNIGHCEATAGVAGLIKVLLSMREGRLPATLHAEIPNPKIDFENSPFYLVQDERPWKADGRPLLAGLSSFGAGGSNSHVILQSYEDLRPRAKAPAPTVPLLVPVSSRAPERTREFCLALAAFLEKHPCRLEDVAHSLRQREEFDHRVAFLADSLPSLLEALRLYLEGRSSDSQVIDPGEGIREAGPSLRALREAAHRWTAKDSSCDEWPAAGGSLVSLPAYRFEKARSWISGARQLYRRPRLSPPLHPLVDRNDSTAGRGLFAKTLDRDEYFVDEHYVQGHPVLPGVCHLEMISHAAGLYLDAPALRLSDIWFLEPIALRESDEVAIRAEISPSQEGFRYEILTGEGAMKHSIGKVGTLREEARAAGRLDIGALLSRCRETMTPEACYGLFAEKGIEQRGRFRVVADFRYNELESVARLVLSPEFGDGPAYGFNPTLLDGAVQAAMIHLHRNFPGIGMVLPFQVGSYLRSGRTPRSAYAVARLKSATARKYDVSITDADGKVLVEFTDLVLKEYKPRRSAARPLLFTTALREIPPARELDGPSRGTPLPACWLAPGPEAASHPSLPAAWSRIPWEAGHPFPEKAVTDWLRGTEGDLPRIVFPMPAGSGEGGRGEDPYLRISRQADRLFHALRALGKLNRPLEFIACLEVAGEAPDPLASACAALFRSLNLELPRIRMRLVEARVPECRDSRDSRSQALAAWVREVAVAAEDARLHVVHVDGRRFAPGVEAWDAAAREGTAGPATEVPRTWMVTGGAGGLGFQAALHLLRSGKRVVMLGRSALAGKRRDALAGFPAYAWEYVQCDLTSASETRAAVEFAAKRFGDAWGVIHCAGILEDGAFLGKEWPAFQRVMAAKVASLIHLREAMAGLQMRRLILFSSLTSVFGNKGQSDYAFANGYLDGVVQGGSGTFPGNPRIFSINWPYWEEGGMRIGEDRLAAYAETFLTQPLPTHLGMDCLDRISAGESVQAGLVYSGATLADVEARLTLKPLPARQEPGAMPAPSRAAAGAAAPADRRLAIRDFLVGFLEQELKLTLSEADLETRLSELGVDSIAQMDLIAKLEKQGRFQEMPQSLLEEHGSVSELIEFFHRNHQDADYSPG